MRDLKKHNTPATQHTKIVNEADQSLNHYTVLDNPDDRITEQTGDGATLVANDNPDDVEDKM